MRKESLLKAVVLLKKACRTFSAAAAGRTASWTSSAASSALSFCTEEGCLRPVCDICHTKADFVGKALDFYLQGAYFAE